MEPLFEPGQGKKLQDARRVARARPLQNYFLMEIFFSGGAPKKNYSERFRIFAP
jgi:hypothetical protein